MWSVWAESFVIKVDDLQQIENKNVIIALSGIQVFQFGRKQSVFTHRGILSLGNVSFNHVLLTSS